MPYKSRKSYSKPRFNKPTPPPMKKTSAPPPVTNQKNANMPTMGDSIKQGLGLGIGLEGARAAMGAIGSMMDGSTPEQVTQSNDVNKITIDCSLEKNLLQKCMNENFDNDNCNDFVKLFNKCNNIHL